MPPLKEEVVVSVEVWPGSIVVGFAETIGALRALFRVTITAVEFTFCVGDPLSRVCSSKDQFPATVRTPVDRLGLDARAHVNEPPRSEYAVADGVFSSHWQL